MAYHHPEMVHLNMWPRCGVAVTIVVACTVVGLYDPPSHADCRVLRPNSSYMQIAGL